MGSGDRVVGWSDLHSQFAFSGAKILRMSILLRPWDVSRMTSGATPISFPTLQTVSGLPGKDGSPGVWWGLNYVCQCFTTAFVESTIVPCNLVSK